MKILLGQIHNEVTSDLRKMSLLWLQLTLVIGNLPVLEGQFFCAFTAFSKTLETNATRSTNGVSCATPHTDSLPPIPPGERKPPRWILAFTSHWTPAWRPLHLFLQFCRLWLADHFTVKLSVRMKSNPDFVATNFTFYDCSTYTSWVQLSQKND